MSRGRTAQTRQPVWLASQPVKDLARHLARYDVEVNVRTISSNGGDVGTVLLDTATELSADLLVLGAYSHARFTEAIFGGVTRRVLREAKVPTLMSVRLPATSWFVVHQRRGKLWR